jgi:hypothetical protein
MVWVIAALVFGAGDAAAQGEQQAVLAVAKKVFDGMRTRDTALMRSVFVPQGARLLGLEPGKDGKPALGVIDPGQWIGGVGRGTGPAWDERIFDPQIVVDGGIAHLWAYYEFWRGPTLSHCGYDSFFMVKLADGWKIAQVADTRRTDCKPR